MQLFVPFYIRAEIQGIAAWKIIAVIDSIRQVRRMYAAGSSQTKRHDQYFHHNGQAAALETEANGKLQKAEYFDSQGKPLRDTSMVNRTASFPGGQEAWAKYLQKNLYWPTGLAFTAPASVTVGIRFWVDANGGITDAEVYIPFHDAFDKIALKIIKNSPKWIPPISHNRTVRVEKMQPVVFSQPE